MVVRGRSDIRRLTTAVAIGTTAAAAAVGRIGRRYSSSSSRGRIGGRRRGSHA